METKLITKLYQDKMKIIYRYLLKIGCSKMDAEDIVQTTFCRAIEYMIELNHSNIASWLFKVSINQYYDLCRKEKRYPTISIDQEYFMNMFIEDEYVEDFFIKKEKSKYIKEILESLSDVSKNLLLLKYALDLSYKEIAEIVDVKEANIKTYLYRARKQFKKIWEEKDNG